MMVQGRPGAGKSVLASFIIDHCKDQKNECVLYFFGKAGDTERREVTQLYRTLLAQLLNHDSSLYPHIGPHYTKSGWAVADSRVEVSTCLEIALSKTSQRLIHIIVDALDEFDDPENVLQTLFRCRSHSSAEVHLIFTSRPIQTSLSFDEVITVQSADTDYPIRRYVDQRVGRMKGLSHDGLDKMVIHEVSDAADGLWLYARLMLDEIEKLPSAALIKYHLERLPHGLTQLYTQILRSKESSFTGFDLLFAQQIYLWLDVSDYMPSFLQMDYLAYDVLSLILAKVNFGQPLFDPISLVSKLCSSLIEAIDSEGEEGKFFFRDFEITTFHYTADQYIKESQNLPIATLPKVLLSRRLHQLHGGVTAIWYFTSCQISLEVLEAL